MRADIGAVNAVEEQVNNASLSDNPHTQRKNTVIHDSAHLSESTSVTFQETPIQMQ